MKAFDKKVSLQLDKAIVAVEQSQARGDKRREEIARSWKRRLENWIFEEEKDKTHE